MDTLPEAPPEGAPLPEVDNTGSSPISEGGFLLICFVAAFQYWNRHYRGDPANTERVERPAPPNGYCELCVFRCKTPDDERFLSAQNGVTLFGRNPPDEDDVERERRVLYVPSPKSFIPDDEPDGDPPQLLTPVMLSNMVVAAVDKSHDSQGEERLPTVAGRYADIVAGLFYEPDNDGGKAVFVPLAEIARHPEKFCVDDRDYYVLNPDVMEDDATEEALKNWRHGMRNVLFVSGLIHMYVWDNYGSVVGVLVPVMIGALFILLWNSKIQLRNGVKLNERLLDEVFFIYDFLSSSIAWLQLTVLIFGYLHSFGVHGEVIHFISSIIGTITSFPVRTFFRWRYGLPPMLPTSRFTSKLAAVCETLAPQGGNFWSEQPRACVEIFGNFEWHFIQSTEKSVVFLIGFSAVSSVVQTTIVDRVFGNTRSAWPQVFIYTMLAMGTYQMYINTPLDILPGLGDELHDGGQQSFAASFAKAYAIEKKNAAAYFGRL